MLSRHQMPTDVLTNILNKMMDSLGPTKPLVVWVNKKSAKTARATWGQCILLQTWDGCYDFPSDMTQPGTLFLSRKMVK